MKKISIAFILILSFFNLQLSAQKEATGIEKTDPLFGGWRFASSSEKDTIPPVLAQGERYLFFDTEGYKSKMAATVRPGNQTTFSSTFTFKKDKKKIYGTFENSCVAALNGKAFVFDYKYNAKKQLLTIIVEKKKYKFVRYRYESI
ncbi:MAG: hypothetical protein IAF38_18525 [Bacteroidia bacterium]|nr:hypothetical protein [Bacteroidia bacterium]